MPERKRILYKINCLVQAFLHYHAFSRMMSGQRAHSFDIACGQLFSIFGNTPVLPDDQISHFWRGRQSWRWWGCEFLLLKCLQLILWSSWKEEKLDLLAYPCSLLVFSGVCVSVTHSHFLLKFTGSIWPSPYCEFISLDLLNLQQLFPIIWRMFLFSVADF